MGSRGKAVRRLLAGTANRSLEDVLAALSSVGFDCHRDSRGHWQCHHSGAGVSLTVCPPHGGRNDVLPAYCRAAQQAVRAVLDWSSDAESDDADP